MNEHAELNWDGNRRALAKLASRSRYDGTIDGALFRFFIHNDL